jgi:hypothetical protein
VQRRSSISGVPATLGICRPSEDSVYDAVAGARLTVPAARSAVQNGRAIGVTVLVSFERPRSVKKITRAQARAEANKRIVACADRNVRALPLPASPRRDSFTTAY